jgi:oxygen-independent coproporphyrinogen-3 oxidase
MGVQSLDEGLLDRLGRVHSREMVFKSFDILRQAGFDNVNIDLMFAIPGQKPLEMPKLDDELPPEPNALIADSEFEIATDVVGRNL